MAPLLRSTTDSSGGRRSTSQVELRVKTPEDQALGERALATALDHVRGARWALAGSEVSRAAALLPDSPPKLQLVTRWVNVQSRGEPASKAERSDLLRLAAAAIREDADFGFAYYVTGDLTLLEDDAVKAHKLLTRAVQLDPALHDAARLLRVVERRTKSADHALKGGRKLS